MTTSDRLAIVNARIWTGTARRPWAEAVLIHGALVELVGSSAEVRKRVVAPTRIIDARGMLVMAGRATAGMPDGEADLLEALRAILRGIPNEAFGALAVGAAANFVMLDRDITRAPTSDAPHVMLVVEAGRVVFERAGLL